MFRITRLELEGPFRSAAHNSKPPAKELVTFSLETPAGEPSDLALFSGFNGTGKTLVLLSILHALGLDTCPAPVRGSMTLLLKEADVSTIYQTTWFRNESQWSRLDGETSTPCSPPQVPIIFVPAHRLAPMTRANKIHEQRIPRMQAMWNRLYPKRPAQIGLVEDELSITVEQESRMITRLGSADLELLLLAGRVPEDFDGLLLIDTPELHMFGPYEQSLGTHLRWIAPKAQILLATNCGCLWDQSLSYQRFLLSRFDGGMHVTPSGEMRNPTDSQAPLDMYLNPGFGGYSISHNDQEIRDVSTYFGVDPDEIRLLDVEHKAAQVEGDWKVSIHAPLWNATWIRREEGWFCIENGAGFA